MFGIEFSSQEAVAKDNFTLDFDVQVLAIVDVPFNFTVTIQNVECTDKPWGVSRRYTFLNTFMFICRYSGCPSDLGPGTQMAQQEGG